MRLKAAIEMIEEEIQDTRNEVNVLDLGCGDGTLGDLLKERFPDRVMLEGADISQVALEQVDAYDHTTLLNLEKEESYERLSREKYDFVVALEVLEHLFNPKDVLEKVQSLLEEGSYLITSFPNIAFWKYRLKLLFGQFPEEYTLEDPSEHLQTFTLDSFEGLLKDAGFEPVEMDGKFVIPRVFRPKGSFLKLARRYPNLFGYQLVLKSRLSRKT